MMQRAWLYRAVVCAIALVGGISPPVAADAEREKILLQNPDLILQQLESGELQPDEVPNPHWRRDGCAACHVGDPAAVQLRQTDANMLCNSCHETASVSAYIHAVGMTPPPEFVERMPDDFYQAVVRNGNVVSCLTCHDLPMQCKEERSREQGLNPFFFRGGPYVARTELCFRCHDRQQYERFNPHDQISDEGVLDGARCFVCHSAMPDRKTARGVTDVQFNVVEQLSQLCTGCHPWRMHPGGGWARYAPGSLGKGGPNHMVVPSAQVLERIAGIELEGKEMLPLDPISGKVTCATCHNPHERGVQFQARADVGADGIRRLRRGVQEICVTCHDK
ncbi:MAG: cytochrome c3 family protein [Pseudomonadota bacterium]